MRQTPTTVLISYSHDSPEHSKRVLDLANKLREHGVDVELDQYHVRPHQGWPRWCEEKLKPEVSKFVLMICTRTYVDRIEGKVSADEGRGVYWEGSFIFNYIYNLKENNRFIPVLLEGSDESHIPMPLQGHGHYRIYAYDLSDNGYKSLYRELTVQPAITKPELGRVIDLERAPDAEVTIQPPVAARRVETAFEAIVAQTSGTDAPASGRALNLWHEKLDFFRHQEATLSEPNQLFQLKRLIEQAETKIEELRREPFADPLPEAGPPEAGRDRRPHSPINKTRLFTLVIITLIFGLCITGGFGVWLITDRLRSESSTVSELKNEGVDRVWQPTDWTKWYSDEFKDNYAQLTQSEDKSKKQEAKRWRPVYQHVKQVEPRGVEPAVRIVVARFTAEEEAAVRAHNAILNTMRADTVSIEAFRIRLGSDGEVLSSVTVTKEKLGDGRSQLSVPELRGGDTLWIVVELTSEKHNFPESGNDIHFNLEKNQ